MGPALRLGSDSGYTCYGFVQGEGFSQRLRTPQGATHVLGPCRPRGLTVATVRNVDSGAVVILGVAAASLTCVEAEYEVGSPKVMDLKGTAIGFPVNFLFALCPPSLVPDSVAGYVASQMVRRVAVR